MPIGALDVTDLILDSFGQKFPLYFGVSYDIQCHIMTLIYVKKFKYLVYVYLLIMKKQVGFSLEIGIIEKFKDLCMKRSINQSDLVEKLVSDWIVDMYINEKIEALQKDILALFDLSKEYKDSEDILNKWIGDLAGYNRLIKSYCIDYKGLGDGFYSIKYINEKARDSLEGICRIRNEYNKFLKEINK